jgi:hypothetical protein
MTSRLVSVLLGLMSLPLVAADIPKGPKQSFEVTHKERFDFQPGGIIRLDNSYGYLTVEGWDEPAVEVTVTKSTDRFADPSWKDHAAELFDQVRVAIERRSDKELAISTTLPRRNSLLTSVLPSGRIIVTTPMPPNNKRGITLEYTVHVPRDSKLIVHHDNGYVWVSDVTGDLDLRSHTGDMIVMLPDPGPYTIDARTRLGAISSDLSGKATSPFRLGGHFAFGNSIPGRLVHLRMGRGSITIKAGPPSGPFWEN